MGAVLKTQQVCLFFIPENITKLERGQTITKINKNLKLLFFRVVLNSKDIKEPKIYAGILYKIEKKPQVKWNKFENFMGHIE